MIGTMRLLPFLSLCSAVALAQDPGVHGGSVARLTAHPPLSAQQLAELEGTIQARPSDLGIRVRLLMHYRDSAPARPNLNPSARAARLRHILYLIENQPGEAAAGSELAYVYTSGGPYADPGDHELARRAWERAANAHPANTNVQLNAARFLYVEHPDDAEDFLVRALDRDPSDRWIAANLGFFYAMDILGMTGPFGSVGRTLEERGRLSARARSELDRTNNPFILAGAATALPNLFMRASMGRPAAEDRTPFEYSAALRARSQQLGAGEPELDGPMPLIRQFQAFAASPNFTVPGRPVPLSFAREEMTEGGSAVRIGAPVQASKLIEKRDPVYPPNAREARIQGIVRFNVLVAADGTIESTRLVSGHPLLVLAAQQALQGYRYQPTLLNGAPVRVITQVEIPFTLQ
jgi:TonB family protein